MAMDFFESQDRARRQTGRLVLLFITAVVLIVIAVYLVVAGVLVWSEGRAGRDPWAALLDPLLLVSVTGGTLAVIAVGSVYKIAELRGGGGVVARQLGGRLISHETTDPNQRKILNVVEEMAIASGTPVPPVYLLADEPGINAFAAGYSPGAAVVGVTRGCIERLSRDQLQGVIAHEFSHILNGDMRLNIRLIGLLNGILIIGILGYMTLRMAAYSGRGYSSRRSGRGGGAVALLLIGAGLAVIGFVGTFFGNLIKAAVSRQREFLADAAAVQFTRNPRGIGGALKVIGGYASGSQVQSPNAPEASHMFFGQAIKTGLTGLLATHPPLKQRIGRIEPDWDGRYLQAARPEPPEAPQPPEVPEAAAAAASLAGGSESTSGGGPPPRPEAPEVGSAVHQVGRPTEAHLDYARRLVEALPRAIVEAAREPYGARAVVYTLVLDAEDEPRQRQLQRLQQHADRGVYDLTVKLMPIAQQLDPGARLPLIDMAAGSLRAMSEPQYRQFERNLRALVEADDRIDLFEWCLQHILLHHLMPEFGRARRPRVRYYALAGVRGDCEVLLSTLAHVGQREPDAVRRAFDAGAARLGIRGLALRPADQFGLDALDRALETLNTVSMPRKRKLLDACAACIIADRRITAREAELLRAVSDYLDCPMPPLLPAQPPA